MWYKLRQMDHRSDVASSEDAFNRGPLRLAEPNNFSVSITDAWAYIQTSGEGSIVFPFPSIAKKFLKMVNSIAQRR